MKPFVIVQQVTAEAELEHYGYEPSNVFLASQENAFMSTRLFELWAREVFFPAIEARRTEFQYTGQVLLLLDGLGSHHTDDFLAACSQREIDVLFLIAHSSNQTQPLDFLTFALMKRHFSGPRFSRLGNAQSNQLVRILGAWFPSSAPHHNIEAFVRMGLVPFREARGPYVPKVDRSRAEDVRRWPAPDGGGDKVPLPPEGRKRVRLPSGK
jgi:hypothetical protein